MREWEKKEWVNLKKYTKHQNAMMTQGIPYKNRNIVFNGDSVGGWTVAAKNLESKL